MICFLSRAILVKLGWLVESIAKKQAITECDKYLYRLMSNKANDIGDEGANAPSPASKQSILSMNGSLSKPDTQRNRRRLLFPSDRDDEDKTVTSSDSDAPNEDNIMIDQYLFAPAGRDTEFKVPQPLASVAQPKADAQPVNETVQSEGESDFSLTFTERNFLTGFVVSVIGFDSESSEMLTADCKAAGAVVINDDNFGGSVDYLICAIDIMSLDGVQMQPKNIVNHNWLVSGSVFAAPSKAF